MARNIQWDQVGQRKYETGVDRGVLYLQQQDGSYTGGTPWNGLVSVSENPSGAEPTPVYADNIKYLNLMSAEEFGCTIEAYTYPDEFAACDGSKEIVASSGVFAGQQSRATFGLSYRTLMGNDIDGDEHGYKIHLVYGALASPSEKAYQTINDTPEAITFSWEVTTTPVELTGFKPTAILTIDSTKVSAAHLAAIEELLYGQAATTEPVAPAVEAELPLPSDIIAILEA